MSFGNLREREGTYADELGVEDIRSKKNRRKSHGILLRKCKEAIYNSKKIITATALVEMLSAIRRNKDHKSCRGAKNFQNRKYVAYSGYL